jgi:hypothetical protein
MCSFGDGPVEHLDLATNTDAPSIMVNNNFSTEILTDMALDANERRTVLLELTQLKIKLNPFREGTINIIGIGYLLCGIIPCRRTFKVGKQTSTETLKIHVTPPMPVLDIKFHNMKSSLIEGQVVHGTIEINNIGGKSLDGLWVSVSDNTLITFANPEDLDGVSNEESDQRMVDSISCPNTLTNYTISQIHLPRVDQGDGGCAELLEPNKTCLVPVVYRASGIGYQTVRMLFVYQSSV